VARVKTEVPCDLRAAALKIHGHSGGSSGGHYPEDALGPFMPVLVNLRALMNREY
jgi:hypothetical protein